MAYEMACVMKRNCLADEKTFHKASHKVAEHGEHRELGEGAELLSLLSRLPAFGPTE